jgi:hypothetical protein
MNITVIIEIILILSSTACRIKSGWNKSKFKNVKQCFIKQTERYQTMTSELNLYFIGIFYKTRGTWVEEYAGYQSLDTALRVAKKQARRYTIACVRDNFGVIAIFDNYSDVEVPCCYHDALNAFADTPTNPNKINRMDGAEI